MNERRRSLLRSILLAAGAAALLLFTIVLPAEYGFDPLGTGELTGLIALSKQEQPVVYDETGAMNVASVVFDLAPFESVEYKLELEQGSSIQFTWSAPLEVAYELHGEPEDGPKGFAQRYEKGRARARRGTFTAPFPGRHGWYFENRRFETIQLELEVVGFFEKAYSYGGGFVEETTFESSTREAPSRQ